MWNFGIGVTELGLLLIPLIGAIILRGRLQRWLAASFVGILLAVVVTPADPLSTLVVAAPLLGTFALGVCCAPYFHGHDKSIDAPVKR